MKVKIFFIIKKSSLYKWVCVKCINREKMKKRLIYCSVLLGYLNPKLRAKRNILRTK